MSELDRKLRHLQTLRREAALINKRVAQMEKEINKLVAAQYAVIQNE